MKKDEIGIIDARAKTSNVENIDIEVELTYEGNIYYIKFNN